MDFATITTIVGLFAGLGLLFAGSGFAYAQFKSGSNKAKDEVIATYKEQALAEKEKATRLAAEKVQLQRDSDVKFNELNKEVGRLLGLYEASERNKAEYLAILQGKDPAQQKFMELVTKTIAEGAKQEVIIQKYMQDTTNALGQITTFMAAMNDKIAQGNAFNEQIEHDTKSGEGEVLRKKVS